MVATLGFQSAQNPNSDMINTRNIHVNLFLFSPLDSKTKLMKNTN